MRDNWKVMSLTLGSVALAGLIITTTVHQPNMVSFVKAIILAAVISSLISIFYQEDQKPWL